MTSNSNFKAVIKARMARTGETFQQAQQALKAERGGGRGAYGRTRAQIESALDEIEPQFKSDDVYERQGAYDAAAMAYDELAGMLADPTLKRGMRLAALMYRTRAAGLRVRHGIPTLHPAVEATLLDLRFCKTCLRGNATDEAQPCQRCPQLWWGPTPATAEDVADYPAPSPVDVSKWGSRPEQIDAW